MKRTALKRRAPLAAKSKTPRARLLYLCDELARIRCMVDAGAAWMPPESGPVFRGRTWYGRCLGSAGHVQGLQWAHIITRSCLRLRHDPDNAVALCVGCHKRWTHQPAQFRAWVIDTYGRDRMERLEQMARQPMKVDLNELAARLEAECIALGAAEHVQMAKERASRRGAR